VGPPGERLLDDGELDCVEQGYLPYAASARLTFKGDVGAAARVSHLQAGYSRYAFPSPGPRSEPAVGEYRDSGPGLLHRIKIKVGEQQAGLRTQ
jgi:hypothetical protein